MNNKHTILAMIEQTTLQVDAMVSLAGALSAGLEAGVVDHGHLYTLLNTQAMAIRGRLDAMAGEILQRGQGESCDTTTDRLYILT
ncbi:hypothetical protein [Dyella sp. ASV21]|uniref:hypothetical protein n=1 Tax=Dyella sp. ASV21 TaxID=2795114 RepID=UPI0018EC702D|nr:hypothetical protein [Dyella sp. ASV21]